MKKITMLALVFLLMACDSLTTIYVDVESETTVKKGLLGGVLSAFGFTEFVSFDVSGSAEFENNDATRDNIGSSYLTGFTLEVVDSGDQTLSFIHGMEIFIGDGETRTRVAYIGDEQDTDVRFIYLDIVEGAEIGQYLRSEKTKISVEANGSPPSEDTTINATASFKIRLQF